MVTSNQQTVAVIPVLAVCNIFSRTLYRLKMVIFADSILIVDN